MATEQLPKGTRFNKKGKPSIIRWRGLLCGSARRTRLAVLGILAVVILCLTFTQLGLVGIGSQDGYAAYIVTILAPIALGGLLLGVWQGTLIGLIAGVIMYLHARIQPLDYFEVNYVTPSSAILLFTVTAFFLSLMLAVALRKNPPVRRRIVYFVIVLFVTSVMFSTAFFINVVFQIVLALFVEMLKTGTQLDQNQVNVYAVSMAGEMGSMTLQILIDAVLMCATCIIADILVRRVVGNEAAISLRTKFRASLLLVVMLAFMATAAVSFVVITEQAKAAAQKNMEDEANYVISQLKANDEKIASFADMIMPDSDEGIDLSDGDIERISKMFSMDSLLSGYTKEADGTIVIFYRPDDKGKYEVFLSDDPEYEVGEPLSDFIGNNYLQTGLSDSGSDTASMAQKTYDERLLVESDFTDGTIFKKEITTEIVYMYLKKYEDYAIYMITPATMVFAGRNATMAWTTLSALVLLLAVFALVSRLLNSIVVRRIDETNEVLGKITAGNLSARVDIRDSREFSSLSDGVNTTVDALKASIAEAESRMDAELATAKEIQESALPRVFPPYPDIGKFDVYATMKPAKMVGGDFYDFFLIGDTDSEQGKLGFVMADVSGKGIPAAMFMMKAKTQLRDYMASGMEIGEAVENTNRQLCDGNDAGMFVTMWVGVIDYGTGHVEYVNAGHNPPLLWQKDSGWQWMREASGLPLGLFDGFPYDTYSVDCGIGDQFLLYTDGVTEAMSVEGELFGENRLLKLVNADFAYHPRALVEAVRHDVARHAAGAEQSDDITILALEVGVPPEVTATIVVPADDAMLPRVNEFIHTELDRRLCPLRAQKQLDIAVEELFVNVCHYAYGGEWNESDGMVRIGYTYSAEPPSVIVTIADDGVAYNPLAKPDAVTPDDVMDVPIGGLGILMAKNSVDEMTYERLDESNIVTIVKKW